jgi:hypothetical protein
VIEPNVREICGRRVPDERLTVRALCHLSGPHSEHEAALSTPHSFGGEPMPPNTRYGWRDGDTSVVVLSEPESI